MNFLITAGPTREPIDPVRFLSNRSSGRMGYAIADAALHAGHEVTLISGPVCIPAPEGAELVRVTTSDEMAEAVQTRMNTGPARDVLVMCAAVADFKPREIRPRKIKKEEGLASIELVPTRDILSSLNLSRSPRAIIMGFAAETESLEKNALKKLRDKRCDVICANDVSRMDTGFDADSNALSLFFRDGSRRDFPRSLKSHLARELVKICVALAENR